MSEDADQSTSDVIDWLYHFNMHFVRINSTSNVKLNNILFDNNGDFNISIDGIEVNINSIVSYWYRRGYINDLSYWKHFTQLESMPYELKHHLKQELKVIHSYIYSRLESKKRIGSINLSGLNKLIVLNLAASFGLIIPATIVTTSKSELIDFKNKYSNIICKAAFEALSIHDNHASLFSYTESVDEDKLAEQPEVFFPNLVQARIEKKYELRVFYLNSEFYTMAIFSQDNPQTETDFRRYSSDKPNRTVPYELPDEIKFKIILLMKELTLNTGSIDIIVDNNNNYVFLEINPIGQYGMTSIPCNYYLDHEIAKYLCNA